MWDRHFHFPRLSPQRSNICGICIKWFKTPFLKYMMDIFVKIYSKNLIQNLYVISKQKNFYIKWIKLIIVWNISNLFPSFLQISLTSFPIFCCFVAWAQVYWTNWDFHPTTVIPQGYNFLSRSFSSILYRVHCISFSHVASNHFIEENPSEKCNALFRERTSLSSIK